MQVGQIITNFSQRERERERCCFFLSDLCEVDHVVSIQKIMKIVTHNRRDQAIIALFLQKTNGYTEIILPINVYQIPVFTVTTSLHS